MIYADQRWFGPHGIGRFANHVLAGLVYRSVPLRSNPAAPLDSWFLSRALRDLKPTDLFFSPGYNTPLFCPAPFMFSIHDLSHIYCTENSSPPIRLYYATVMKRACRLAACILTVSNFTRNQIIAWSGVPAEKVVNVGCGVDAAYTPEGQVYRVPYSYLLCVSNRKRHKNEFRIVRAFASVKTDAALHLLFTGNPDPGLKKLINSLGIDSRVHFTGVVPETDLPSLYRGAVALVFSSLYEGFGLPILEAMACGIPVVTSNVTAMPEIAADAAVLVDPTSVEEITDAIQQVAYDGSLRIRLREKGLKRAREFNWTSTAGRVHQILLAR